MGATTLRVSPRVLRPAATRRRLADAALVFVLASALFVVPGALAAGAATTTGTLQARAALISGQLTANEQQLATIGSNYVAARERYHEETAAVRVSNAAISDLSSELEHDRMSLYRAAIAAYVGGNDSSVGLLLVGNAANLDESSTYLRVASNTLSQEAVSFSDTEHARLAELGTERRAADSAHVALTSALTERAAAITTLGRERSLLSSVRGQLAALVAAQQAAAARAAAAAAAAAAARNAAASASHAPGATPGATPSAAPTAGPPSAATAVSVAGAAIPPGSLQREFAAIRECESGGIYSLNTGNGYYGAYQFSLSTWEGLGGVGLPSSAAPTTQDSLAYRLYDSSGFYAWPECAAILGL